MSNQIQATGAVKIRSLTGALTATSGVVSSVPLGGANGVATLDSAGKVPVTQLPSSVMEYKGTWNAATNTPTLVNGTGDTGDVYICNVAGTANFGAGPITFAVGDWAVYNGSIWQKSGGASGTVTSVAVTESGDALTVTGSPITTFGTINIGFAGVASQYVRGDGTLANFPTSGGGGGSVSYYLNGSINQGTFGGNTYYEMNKTPIIGAGTDFSRSTNGYIASFLTDANDPALLNIPAGNWNFETYFQASSGGGSPTFYIQLYKYDGTTFTLIASNSGTPKLINDGTNIEAYFSALAVPETTLTLTDRLAVRIYVNTSGRTITLHTENSHLCQVITTFSTGITALNGLTAQVQYFGTGTSGTDFNISSTTATHTFNLPVASVTNTGKLSSTDWTTFNSKVGGTGTLNYLPKITGTGTSLTLGNSLIYDDGTNIGIGTTSPFYKFDVNGIGRFSSQVYASSFQTTSQNGITIDSNGGSTGGALKFTQTTSSSVGGPSESSLSINSNTQFRFYYGISSGVFKGFYFDNSSLTTNTYRTYTMPDASGTLLLNTAVSGTTNYIPKFTSANVIGNSSIIDDGSYIDAKTNVFSIYQPSGVGPALQFYSTSSSANMSSYSSSYGNGSLDFGGSTISFSCGPQGGSYNSLAVFFNSSGNVSIGNTNDTYKLDVTGTGRFTENVGIGMAPNERLSIAGSNGLAGMVRWTDSATASAFLGITSGGVAYIHSNNNSLAFGANGSNNFAETMRLTSGLVGIGTTTPGFKLHVLASDGLMGTFGTSSTSGGYVGFRHSTSTVFGYLGSGNFLVTGASVSDFAMTTGGLGNLIFGTGAGNERMRVTSGGQVQINNTVDTAQLSSYTSINNWNIYARATAASGAVYGFLSEFGNQAPNNTSSYFYYGGDTGGQRFSVRANGGIYNYQANDSNLSDIRTKKDIIPLESYWNKFKAIQIVKYKYKDQDHNDYNIGVIAQQVEEIAPEFIDTDYWDNPKGNEKTEMKSVFTTDLYHATIKVLQEAMDKIEILEAEINELKNK